MIKSMTGYGRGESSGRYGAVTAEVKSLNNKFFELNTKLPDGLFVFEDKIREYFQKRIKRGRVNLSVTCDTAAGKAKRLVIEKELAGSLISQLKELKKANKLSGEVDINTIAAFPGMVAYAESPGDINKIWINVRKALDIALKELDKSRTREGLALSRDLVFRTGRIRRHIAAITKRSELSVGHYKKELSKRIKELSGGIDVSKERLAQEVAIYAKNCDITEEITRVMSHVQTFEQSLRAGGEQGKILDFMAQELMREANTMGAKSSDFSISSHSIKIKSEIEKIREQVKNIE